MKMTACFIVDEMCLMSKYVSTGLTGIMGIVGLLMPFMSSIDLFA